MTHVQIVTFLKFLLPSPSSLLKLPNNKPPDRVPKILTFKMRQSPQLFLWKWVLFAWECKIISISKAAHLTSFWYRGLREHGHSPFTGPLAKTTIEQIVKGGGSYQKHFLQIFENFISVGFVLCNTDHNKFFLEGRVVQYTRTESGRMTLKSTRLPEVRSWI